MTVLLPAVRTARSRAATTAGSRPSAPVLATAASRTEQSSARDTTERPPWTSLRAHGLACCSSGPPAPAASSLPATATDSTDNQLVASPFCHRLPRALANLNTHLAPPRPSMLRHPSNSSLSGLSHKESMSPPPSPPMT
ncbi:hypothetical protein GTA08_BOTSDO03028 [Botryosphaeria dothidea]|uniref:Uncharacterized protein n=1 Tax=Botryosphaeria dothidea TaxID=55169 RepID=A0A8H4NCJ0_9PEZI|nr:hypothetical protein GTA08_BOTSDO03028 [Botryosphaeria dothidea]